MQAEACRHDLPIAGPRQDSSDMDELKTLSSSEPTSISAQGPDGEPPSSVVGIAASLCQLGTVELLLDAEPIESSMDFVREAIL
jgi:hypothetical protein